jgi:general nucleoside transport system permease protein
VSDILSVAFLAQLLRIAVPYACAAMGGVTSERSGTVDLALEGKLLMGAFGAAVVGISTGSAILGVFGGIATGALVGLVHAVIAVRLKADGVVTGVAVNLLAVGLTRLLLRLLYDSSSNSPKLPTLVGDPSGTGGLAALGHVLLHPIFLGTVAAVVLVHLMISRTRFGLRIRSVGEHPAAAQSLGVRPVRVRTLAVLLSGALAGLGGVWLAFDQRQFTHEMSAGRGFIALAAVIVGGWRPLPAALACLAFGLLEALQIALQGVAALPSQLVGALPFVVTIVAVAGLVGRSRAPAALGREAEH